MSRRDYKGNKMVWFILYLIGFPITVGFILTYEDGKLLGDGWRQNTFTLVLWPFCALCGVGHLCALLMQKIVPELK